MIESDVWNPVSTRPLTGGTTGRAPAAISTCGAVMTRPSTSNTLSPMNRAVPSISVRFGVPVARYSRPPAEIGIDPAEDAVTDDRPVGAVELRVDPELRGGLRRHRHVGREDEHLGGDAPAVETRAAEHVALDERDLPAVEELRNRVARPAPDDDQVELLGA